MRNLKRALSLLLSSTMVLGMLVMGSSAVSYSDVTSKENVEAIEVLNTVGVMVGDQNGNFNPSAPVTREEMAVIMCRLLDYTVSTYKGTTKFTDVSEWALPYVEACYTNGIIAGYSETQFGGKDTVTTGQAALMIMKALGYFQEAGDFGTDWLVETVKVGSQIQLFNGVVNGANEALTRNDVAQLVLNALKAECVQIGSHDLVSDGKGGFTTKANYVARTAPAATAKYAAVDNTRATNNDQIINLGEELYNGDLKKVQTGVTDDFGRPSTEWSYKLEKIGTFADDPIMTYTAGVNKMDLYNLLGKTVVDGITADEKSMTVYTDGTGANGNSTKVVVSDAMGTGKGDNRTDNSTQLADYAVKNDKAKTTGTGNGVLTEVYMDVDGNVTIVEVNTYLVESAGDYNAIKEELRIASYDNAIAAPLNAGASVLSADDFNNLEGIKDGDFLLVTVADGEVMSVAAAETLTGTVDQYAQDHSSVNGKEITIDGTVYKYSEKAGGQANEDYAVGEKASVILDQYGYIIGVAEAMVASNFAYVMDAENVGGLRGGEVKAVLAYTDGTTETVKINKLDTTSAGALNPDAQLDNKWFAYSKSSDGSVSLMTTTTGYDVVGDSAGYNVGADKTIMNGTTILAYNTQYDASHPMANLISSSTIGGKLNNDKTVLMVIDGEDDVTVYNGAKNMPAIYTTANKTDSDKVFVTGLAKKTDSAYVSFVVVDLGNLDTDEYVILDTSATPDYMFLLDKVSEIHDKDGKLYYTYETLMSDGTVQKVTFDATNAANQYNLIHKAYYNKDGYVTSSTAVGTTTPYFNAQYTQLAANGSDGAAAQLSYSNGALQIKDQDPNGTDNFNFIVTNDTKIVFIAEGGTTLTKYANVSYEVNEVKASYLDSVLGGTNYFTGRVAGNTVEANTNVLETLYIYVDGFWTNGTWYK